MSVFRGSVHHSGGFFVFSLKFPLYDTGTTPVPFFSSSFLAFSAHQGRYEASNTFITEWKDL